MALRSHRNKNILMFADTDRDADMLYLTRFGAPDPFVYLRPASGRSYVVMSDLEIDRARKEASVNRVLSFTHYARIARDRFGKKAGVVETIVCLLREFKIRSVIVPPQFPLALADGLRRRRITVKAAPAPFLPEREIKSPNEVDAIRKAMRSTERAIRAAFDVLEKSKISSGYVVYKGRRLTAEALKAVINTNLMGQGYLPSFTIVASGKHGCDPHDAGSGPIRANSPIIIDVFPRSEQTGYFADITRTVVRGKASPFVERMYRAVHSAQTGALKQIRAGAVARDIHQAIVNNFKARGFETGEKDGRHQGFFHGTGHGIGLEIHEAPRIATNTTKLKKGMVVTVEPGLYYYPHGGVRIEDSVVVTPTGIDNLTRLPKFLEI